MRRIHLAIAAAVVLVVLVVGILQSSGGTEAEETAAPTPAGARESLRGAPPALAALHADANELIDGERLDERIEELRGHPIVVNVWGSWCTPCREEFPIFQRVAAEQGRRVAFLGIATRDAKEDAAEFLSDNPLTYPSYLDFDGKLANSYGLIATPATIFYDARGRRAYLHQGKYSSDEDLEADIRRYTGA